MLNTDYDIEKAFKAIEDELIASMMRNLASHRAEETDMGFNWSQWQVEQLKALERYKAQNKKKFTKSFSNINDSIEAMIFAARQEGGTEQEQKILRALKKGLKASKVSQGTEGAFFKLNTRKLEALIKATKNDFGTAEKAMLRMSEDKYRQIIFNAEVYAATGAGTYEKAVDMATKDFLKAGINCIEYSNGARHTVKDYAKMAIQTASKRAYLTGEGEMRQSWGISTVIMNKRANACPKCLPFVGKILIDDVWSGGKASDGPYPLMSSAMAAGLYHPNCKDVHTTYFPELDDEPDSKFSKKELEQVKEDYRQDQKQQYAGRMAEQYGRLSEYSLDPDNKKMYAVRKEQWENVRFRTGNVDSKQYADSKRPLANFRALQQDKAVNILREESEEWIKNLTNKEKYAIKKYTYNSGDKKPNRFFERLNAMLRGDREEDKKLREYANIISGALGKNRLKHDIICYRNMEFNPYEKYQVGDIFEDKQFISTSVSQHSALVKKFKMIFLVPKSSRGAYIECISKYPKQREFLLDRNCKMRILSKQEDSILVEVLP